MPELGHAGPFAVSRAGLTSDPALPRRASASRRNGENHRKQLRGPRRSPHESRQEGPGSAECPAWALRARHSWAVTGIVRGDWVVLEDSCRTAQVSVNASGRPRLRSHWTRTRT